MPAFAFKVILLLLVHSTSRLKFFYFTVPGVFRIASILFPISQKVPLYKLYYSGLKHHAIVPPCGRQMSTGYVVLLLQRYEHCR